MESLAADAILHMTGEILAAVTEMEGHLEQVALSLGSYKANITDTISQDAEQLVKDIRAHIDAIKEDCEQRNQYVKQGSLRQKALESRGISR